MTFYSEPVSLSPRNKVSATKTLTEIIKLLIEYDCEGCMTDVGVDHLYTLVESLQKDFEPFEEALLILKHEETEEVVYSLGRLLLGLSTEFAYMKSKGSHYLPNDWTKIYIKQVGMLLTSIVDPEEHGYALRESTWEAKPTVTLKAGRVPLFQNEQVLSVDDVYNSYTDRDLSVFQKIIEQDSDLRSRKATLSRTLADYQLLSQIR